MFRRAKQRSSDWACVDATACRRRRAKQRAGPDFVALIERRRANSERAHRQDPETRTRLPSALVPSALASHDERTPPRGAHAISPMGSDSNFRTRPRVNRGHRSEIRIRPQDGAGRGNRTPTVLPPADFESATSTSSVIPARDAAARCPCAAKTSLSPNSRRAARTGAVASRDDRR
jgi:hypothetical protein